jgi:phosphoribosylanthranilate isomerase
MVKVKICGLTNADDYRLAQCFGADYSGFIFYSASPRAITPKSAAEIVEQCPGSNQRVGVFVNETIAAVRSVFALVKLDIVQLHGDESPQYCRELGLPFWKVLRPKTAANLAALEDFGTAIFLVDTFSPSTRGGTGQRCAAELVELAIKSERAIVVAGGVSADNIGEILSWRPFAVDVCSSLEAYPGKKDQAKMTLFFKKLKEWRNDHER